MRITDATFLILPPLSCNIRNYFTCLICFSPSNKYYHPIPCLPLGNCSILAVFIIYSYLCIYLFLAYISSLGCQAIRPQFWSVFVVLNCILVCLNVASLLALQVLHSEISSFIFWYLYYAYRLMPCSSQSFPFLNWLGQWDVFVLVNRHICHIL